MSRLGEMIRTRLGGFALTALIAWSLARPLLSAMGIAAEEGMAGLLALSVSLLISLFTLIPKKLSWAVPLLATAALVLSAIWLKGSFPARIWAFARSLASGAPPRDALRLYFDALLPAFLLLLALYARLLMEGDPAFSLPLLVVPITLLWFLGARESAALYFPAVLCLPLLYAYTSRSQGDEVINGRGRMQWLRTGAVALALALLASLFTPAYRQTLAPAEQMADTIRRTMEDYFFFTDSRNMFTLGSQGYQPMAESGLGGRPSISRAPVMKVETAGKIYLRGTALDRYSGRAWFDSLSGERYGWLSLRFAGLKGELFNESLPQAGRAEGLSATVTLLHEMPSTLFMPQRPRALSLGEGMVAYFNASSELFITHDLKPEDSYTFRYEPYVAGDRHTDALAAGLSASGQAALPDLPSAYTGLPGHLMPDGIVAELARGITGGMTDPYSQAAALMRYLKSNYAYSLDVPDAPENLDFASHFLFDVKAGYCTYFATAMTVLARSLGLPARYVEGFLAVPGDSDSITLSGENAHAWTEIYIAGLGWVTFDATPSEGDSPDGNGQEPPPESQPSPSPEPSPSPQPTPSSEPQPSENPEEVEQTPTPAPVPNQDPTEPTAPRGSRFPWWLLILLALLGLLGWRIWAETPLNREKKLKGSGERFSLWWDALLEARGLRGQGLNPSETALEYAGRTGDKGLLELANAHSAKVYGRQAPDEASVSLARGRAVEAWQALNPGQKARLALRRVLRPVVMGVRNVKDGLLRTARRIFHRV